MERQLRPRRNKHSPQIRHRPAAALSEATTRKRKFSQIADDSVSLHKPDDEATTMAIPQVKQDIAWRALDRPYKDHDGWKKRRQQEQPPPGGWPKPPAHWPPGVRVDVGRRVYWLPPDWGQGVKLTCPSRLVTYVSPEGRTFYHRHVVERIVGRKLGPSDGKEGLINWAKTQIKSKKDFRAQTPKFHADARLFACLSKKEQSALAAPKDFHFAVISALRATDMKGVRGIVNVQAQLTASGAEPKWYVDEASLQDYLALGLDAVVGGKLVPARNKALQDAARMKKACVQVSDDICSWSYYDSNVVAIKSLQAGNLAAKKACRMRISPVAAARFLLAKMRASRANERPKLGGVFPLANTGAAFLHKGITNEHFILGDFFVHDLSPCRFDQRMTLKEDYDFTCTHLARHGTILRCNRMFIQALHETNAGGAVAARDDSGHKERANIRVLQEKWPGVFHINGNRGDTQVIMCWKRRKGATHE